MTDRELMGQYVEAASQQAFEQLVRRLGGWVHGCARRRVRDAHSAEDVAQAVFILLSQNASKVGGNERLAAWLFKATHFCSANALKQQARRQKHEREAAMQQMAAADAAGNWEEIWPVLDEAVAKLGAADREAILLRFYQGMSLSELASAIGTGEEAATKRVQRAVEKLRGVLAKEGVTAGAAALGVVMAEKVTAAAPAGLVEAVTAAVGGGGSASAGVIAKGAMKMMVWAKVKVAAIVVVAVGLSIGGIVAGVTSATKPSRVASSSATSQMAVAVVGSSDATMNKPIAELASRLEETERRITNLHVQGFELVFERRGVNDLNWEKVKTHYAGEAWFDGVLDGRHRVSFSDRTWPWENGPALWHQEALDEGFDGKWYREVSHKGGPYGSAQRVGYAIINMRQPRLPIRDRFLDYATGRGFHLGYRLEQGRTISQVLRVWLALKQRTLAEISDDEIRGTHAIRLSFSSANRIGIGSSRYWFDPKRDYALLKYEMRVFGEIIQADEILELADPGHGVWFPTKATHQEPELTVDINAPKRILRVTYTATRVDADDPKFDESVFVVPVPRGYRVEDDEKDITFIMGGDPVPGDKRTDEVVAGVRSQTTRPAAGVKGRKQE